MLELLVITVLGLGLALLARPTTPPLLVDRRRRQPAPRTEEDTVWAELVERLRK